MVEKLTYNSVMDARMQELRAMACDLFEVVGTDEYALQAFQQAEYEEAIAALKAVAEEKGIKLPDHLMVAM